MAIRKSLSDILRSSDRQNLSQLWNSTKPADNFAPLPTGTYTCHVLGGEPAVSRSGTPGYKVTFRVIEGEFTGRQLWTDFWLTPAALPITRRDLGKLGITDPEQLDRPLPRGIRCGVKVVKRTRDDGTDHNEVRAFDVLGIDTPERDPFAPDQSGNGATSPLDPFEGKGGQ